MLSTLPRPPPLLPTPLPPPPLPPHVASAMDGHGSEYLDFFSQASSLVDPMSSAPAFTPNASDFGLFSQAPSYGPGSSSRRMEGLDLNSDADGYPHIQSYQGLLQAEGVPGGRGLPPLRLGTRSGTVPFLAHCPSRGACGSKKHLTARAAGRRTMSGFGGGHGGSTANRIGHGSMATRSFVPPMDAYGAHAMEKADDNGLEEGVRFVG